MTKRTRLWLALLVAPLVAWLSFGMAVAQVGAQPPLWGDVAATFLFLVCLSSVGVFAICARDLLALRRKRQRR